MDDISLITNDMFTPGVCTHDLRLILTEVMRSEWLGIPGDIVEMGCAGGHTSVAIGAILKHVGSSKILHVCDSFEGLPPPTHGDGPFARMGMHKAGIADVLAKFQQRGIAPPVIHAGMFADLTTLPPIVAMAFCDGELFRSITDSLVAVYPRLSRGATVFVHDYGNQNYPGAKLACDEFFSDKSVTACRSIAPNSCLGIFTKWGDE